MHFQCNSMQLNAFSMQLNAFQCISMYFNTIQCNCLLAVVYIYISKIAVILGFSLLDLENFSKKSPTITCKRPEGHVAHGRCRGRSTQDGELCSWPRGHVPPTSPKRPSAEKLGRTRVILGSLDSGGRVVSDDRDPTDPRPVLSGGQREKFVGHGWH
jgi:hypothetical protein